MIALPFDKIIHSPMAAAYVEQANQLLQDEMQTTLQLITDGRDRVRALADCLVQKNHLTGEEILAALK